MTALPKALAALTTADAGLGLESGQVEVVEHNTRWSQLAEDVAAHLRVALSGYDVEVEHVGSTSVPGLAAKPLLDFAVGMRPGFDSDAVIAALEEAGLVFQVDLGDYGGLLFTVNRDPETAVAHIHVVDVDDFQWDWYRTFRDGLRSNPTLRVQYEELKRSAAAENSSNREGYTQAKFDWVLATVSSLSAIEPPNGA